MRHICYTFIGMHCIIILEIRLIDNGYCAILISFPKFYFVFDPCDVHLRGHRACRNVCSVYIIHTHLRIFSLHFITWRLSSGDSLKCFSMAILRLMGKT